LMSLFISSQGSPMDPMVMKRPQLYGMGSNTHSQQQQSSPYPGGSYGPPGTQRYPLGMQGRAPGALGGMQYPQQQVGASFSPCLPFLLFIFYCLSRIGVKRIRGHFCDFLLKFLFFVLKLASWTFYNKVENTCLVEDQYSSAGCICKTDHVMILQEII
jgi:hypothetical protein